MIQNPVSVFRFNKVYSADQVMATHEFVVDHLLNTLQGQNWVLHWNPATDYTECQILFPINPDRMTHIRPLANYFQQHFTEDPSVIYRTRAEFIDNVRAFDMNRCLELGGWGLTTMSRLNNIGGKVITEVRTKIISPTEVVYKYITREAPIIGQSVVSPLAVLPMGGITGLGHNIDSNEYMGYGNLDRNMPYMLRGLHNLRANNFYNYAPVGLTTPIGVGIEGSGLDSSRFGSWTDGMITQGTLTDKLLDERLNTGLHHSVSQDLGLQQSLGLNRNRFLNLGNPANLVTDGFNQAVVQTLNPALCETQTPLKVGIAPMGITSPMLGNVVSPMGTTILKKVVC